MISNQSKDCLIFTHDLNYDISLFISTFLFFSLFLISCCLLLFVTAPLAGSEEDEEADEELVANYQRAISVSENNQVNGDISMAAADGAAINDGTLCNLLTSLNFVCFIYVMKLK